MSACGQLKSLSNTYIFFSFFQFSFEDLLEYLDTQSVSLETMEFSFPNQQKRQVLLKLFQGFPYFNLDISNNE